MAMTKKQKGVVIDIEAKLGILYVGMEIETYESKI